MILPFLQKIPKKKLCLSHMSRSWKTNVAWVSHGVEIGSLERKPPLGHLRINTIRRAPCNLTQEREVRDTEGSTSSQAKSHADERFLVTGGGTG